MSFSPHFIAFPALGFVLFLAGCALETTATPTISPGVSLSGNLDQDQLAESRARNHLLTLSVTRDGTAAPTSFLTTGTNGSDAYGGYIFIDTGACNVTGEYPCVTGTT